MDEEVAQDEEQLGVSNEDGESNAIEEQIE